MLTKKDIKHIKKQIQINGETLYIIKRPKGLGDTIENILHTGIIGKITHFITGLDEPCEPCKKRRDKLNETIKYN